MTTIIDFIASIQAVQIEGIKKYWDHPPLAVDTSELPSSWVQNPEMSHDAMTFQSYGGWPTMKARLVTIIMPYGQSTQRTNWLRVLEMMEAVDTAFCSLQAGSIGRGKITWVTRQAEITLGSNSYWGTVTDIEGHG